VKHKNVTLAEDVLMKPAAKSAILLRTSEIVLQGTRAA
jgi:hypothetical protein